jgi:predicted alpha/beta-hydrolase family hydrolase
MTEIPTPYGAARADLTLPASRPLSRLFMGHGASGDVTAPDLVALRNAAVAAGVAVVMVTQPYRVAGRRAPAPAAHLDVAWCEVVRTMPRLPADLPLVVGGRSSGARVACRTAVELGAAGVVALAFPLHPPARAGRARVPATRAAELDTGLPTLVVNGDRDPFGVPEPHGAVEVCIRQGESHALRRDPAGVAAAVVSWLVRHSWAGPSG